MSILSIVQTRSDTQEGWWSPRPFAIRTSSQSAADALTRPKRTTT